MHETQHDSTIANSVHAPPMKAHHYSGWGGGGGGVSPDDAVLSLLYNLRSQVYYKPHKRLCKLGEKGE